MLNPNVQYIPRKGNNGGTLMTWPKGVSGNPSGMKKGTKTFKTLIAEALEKKLDHDGVEITTKEKITHVIIAKALKGNLNAITEIMDRLDGTPDSAGNNELIESLGADGIGLIADLANRLAERKRAIQQAEQSAYSTESAESLQAIPEAVTVSRSGE